MKRFSRILAVYDLRVGSEELLRRAQALAQANEARLKIVEVLERLPRDIAQPRPSVVSDDHLRNRLLEECKARLERVAARDRKSVV